MDKARRQSLLSSFGVTISPPSEERHTLLRQDVMSIAETYRAMSEDVRRLADEAKDEGAREAYLALAKLWRERSLALESAAFEKTRSLSGQSEERYQVLRRR